VLRCCQPSGTSGARPMQHPNLNNSVRHEGAEDSRLLLIRLFQQTTRCSVGGWPGRPFPRTCASFNVSSRPRVEIDDTWVGGPQAGLRGSRQLKGRKAVIVVVAVDRAIGNLQQWLIGTG
jgi:hypothetical protein